MGKVNIAGYTVSANPTAPNSLFQQDGGGGQGVTFVPKLTETSRGYELSWTNDGGLPNPDPVEITNGTDGAPGTDGENGATFIPSVTSREGGHKLSWTNDQGLPNPPDVTILDGQGGGGGILEEFIPSTWAEALKTVAIAVTESAAFDISGDIVYHTLSYEFSDYNTRIQSDEETYSGASIYIESPFIVSNVEHRSLTNFEVVTDVSVSLSDTFNTRGILEINSGKVTALRIGTYPITSASLNSVNDVREIFLDEEITLLPNTPPSVKLYRLKT